MTEDTDRDNNKTALTQQRTTILLIETGPKLKKVFKKPPTMYKTIHLQSYATD